MNTIALSGVSASDDVHHRTATLDVRNLPYRFMERFDKLRRITLLEDHVPASRIDRYVPDPQDDILAEFADYRDMLGCAEDHERLKPGDIMLDSTETGIKLRLHDGFSVTVWHDSDEMDVETQVTHRILGVFVQFDKDVPLGMTSKQNHYLDTIVQDLVTGGPSRYDPDR